jgi:glycosyltransferase involved in cell wall biosynthesis
LTKKIRIMHLSANQYQALPAEHHTKNIWHELSKDCDEYHIVARSNEMTFSHTIEGKLHLHLVPCLGKRQMVFFLLSFLLPYFFWKYKPTHIIAQCPVLGGSVAALCKSLFNFRLFTEIHGEHYFKPIRSDFIGKIHHLCFKFITKFTFKRADKIRSLSDSMTLLITNTYGHSNANKIAKIPNRVNLKTFNTIKSDYNKDNELKIITVGRFSVLKNHLNLINDLYSSHINCHLTIVGLGNLKEDYKRLAEKLGCQSQLTILENISHEVLSRELPNNDVYIHYAISEAVPRAILEAMACGLPVLATNVGYIDDVIEQNVNGVILNKPYKNDLHTHLSSLFSSTELRQLLGSNARESVEKNYEWHLVFDKYRSEIERCGKVDS